MKICSFLQTWMCSWLSAHHEGILAVCYMFRVNSKDQKRRWLESSYCLYHKLYMGKVRTLSNECCGSFFVNSQQLLFAIKLHRRRFIAPKYASGFNIL